MSCLDSGPSAAMESPPRFIGCGCSRAYMDVFTACPGAKQDMAAAGEWRDQKIVMGCDSTM